MIYALDTDTVSYLMKGIGQVGVRVAGVAPSSIAVPAVSVHELMTGVEKSPGRPRLRPQLEALLNTVTVLPFDIESARASAILRAALESAGIRIGALDTLIAGTAVAFGATLVTHNTREFSRVPGLRIEDWYGPE